MEKMLFEFDYRDNTIYCIVDFYESFVKDCKLVYIDALWSDYSFSTHFILPNDNIEDVSSLKSNIFNKVVKCIVSFFLLAADFKRRWNLYCDSVPRVYQFEKESLFNDSSIKKFSGFDRSFKK